jgi:hypothetical protein
VWDAPPRRADHSSVPRPALARLGLRTRLPRIPDYVQRSLEIAHLLTKFDQISNPAPAAHQHDALALRGDRQKLEDAAYQIAIEKGIFSFFRPGRHHPARLAFMGVRHR